MNKIQTGLSQTFSEELAGDVARADKLEEDSELFKMIADGYPAMEMEIRHRACIKYPITSGAFLVFVYKAELETETLKQNVDSAMGKIKLTEIKDRLSNMIDAGLSYHNKSLEFELANAYKTGKSIKQVLNTVVTDLKKIKDSGMKRDAIKYLPLIEILKEDNTSYVKLTLSGRSLFE